MVKKSLKNNIYFSIKLFLYINYSAAMQKFTPAILNIRFQKLFTQERYVIFQIFLDSRPLIL